MKIEWEESEGRIQCRLCEKTIKKGKRYLSIGETKTRYGSYKYFRLCEACIFRAYKTFSRQDLKRIQDELILEIF